MQNALLGTFFYTFDLHYVIIGFLEEEEKAGYFVIIVLQMYCYYKYSVALPHSAVGLSAVCDCGIS